DVIFSGGLVWSGGTMKGSGRTIISPSGTLNISGTTPTLSRTLDNNGTTTWTSSFTSTFTMAGGTFNNNGTFQASINAIMPGLTVQGNTAANVFNNVGTFTKSGNGDLTFRENSA